MFILTPQMYIIVCLTLVCTSKSFLQNKVSVLANSTDIRCQYLQTVLTYGVSTVFLSLLLDISG